MARNLPNRRAKYNFFRYQSVEMLILFSLVLFLRTSFAEEDEPKDEPDFECGPENGNFADPKQCRRYITCTNGAATKRVCPSGLYWDDEKLFCTYKSEAKCGPIVR